LESQLCQMVFYWGKHLKACSEADTSEKMFQCGTLMKECATEADTGERIMQTCKRAHGEGFITNDTHVLVELNLS
jgi:DnaJ-class molecular chaperone